MAAKDGGSAGDGTGSPGKMSMVIGLAAVTVLAVAGGGAIAWQAHSGGSEVRKTEPSVDAHAALEAEVVDPDVVVMPLSTIMTNLKGDNAPWVRMDLSVTVAKGTPDQGRLAAEIGQDMLAFIRTLSPESVTGGTSLDLLRGDLLEIARIRTEGAAKNVLFRSLILE